MRVILLLMAAAAFGFAADPAKAGDPWNGVRSLKSGCDVRIYKTGSARPLAAKFIEAGDGKLVYVIKNAQSSIARKDVERVEFRPRGTSEKTESRSVGMGPDGLNDSWNSGKSWSREGWQVVYQRPR